MFTFGEGPWKPVPALLQANADVSLFFLAANSLTYGAPVSDPYFAANIPHNFSNSSTNNTNLTVYKSNNYITILKSIDQHQYYNPNNDKCTTLLSSENNIEAITALNLSTNQLAIGALIALYQLMLSMFYCVSGRGSGALRASESVFELSQVGIPNDQWMIEVSSWFAITVAKIQEIPIRWATGPTYVPAGSRLERPSRPEERHLCNSQIILSPGGTTSFSVLGIGIILNVGILLILLSLFLDSLTGYFRSRLFKNDYKRVQWGLDGIFQLHRLAYEAAGQGAWTGGANSIPITKRGDLIGGPEFHADSRHPTLHMREKREEPAQLSEPDQITTTQYPDQNLGGYVSQKSPFFPYAPLSS